ncbi:MAG: hypothetical protein IT538_09805 [Variibacter sp.]|nr:hypothetical protein [Variibacter sp.]
MSHVADAPGPSLQSLGAEPLTVACVYRSGGKVYSARYVHVLRDMVARNLSLPHRFVCLTDDPAVETERIPLVTDWPGYWSKLELYRPGLFGGPVLYVDLDTIIHGSIDRLGQMAGEVPFGCVTDPLGGYMNSSVMTFSVDCSFIFQRFGRLGFYDRHLRPWLRWIFVGVGLGRPFAFGGSYGDQGFADMCLQDAQVPVLRLDQALPGMFSTFNFSASAQARPAGSICLMMGYPKPHEIRSGWIAQHWREGTGRATA